jgi:hypothetical protein
VEDPFDIELEKLLNDAKPDQEEEAPPPKAHVTKVGFWFGWMIATGLGWIIGMVLFLFLGELIEPFLESVLQMLTWGILGAIPGAAIGINQWYVLSNTPLARQVGWLRSWLIITIISWMIALMIISGTALGDQAGFALTGGILGGITSLGQALVFRKEIPKWWLWVPVNIVTWAMGLALIDILPQGIGFSLAGLLSGMISGLDLVWLLQGYRPDPERGEDFTPVFSANKS